MQWQARTVAAAVDRHGRPLRAGRLPFDVERLVQAMYRNEYARGGPVLNSAIAAIEFALWDICGKSLGQPVYNLFGGQVHWQFPPTERLVRRRGGAPAKTWRPPGRGSPPAIAVSSSIRSALKAAIPISPTSGAAWKRWLRCAPRSGPTSRSWSTPTAALASAPRARSLRRSPKNGVVLARGAGRPGKLSRPRPGRAAGGLRIAVGERCYSRYQRPLSGEGRPHVLQPIRLRSGGCSRPRRSRLSRNAVYRPVSFHCPFGPVASAAVLQLGAATTNIVARSPFRHSMSRGGRS